MTFQSNRKPGSVINGNSQEPLQATQISTCPEIQGICLSMRVNIFQPMVPEAREASYFQVEG